MVFKESVLKNIQPYHIDEICRNILPNGQRKGRYWKIGNVKGDKGNSMGVCLEGKSTGYWKDFATGECGNVLELIKSVLHLDTRNAFDWLESRYGNANHSIKGSLIKPKTNNSIAYALQIWELGLVVKGTLGEKYFQSRAIFKQVPPSIRYINNLRHYPSKSSFPALLCSIQNHLGAIQGVQRIYLSKDGKGKAEINPVKMILGEMKGHAIRLSEASTILGICEGVETALSIIEAGVNFPIWSAISASNMHDIKIPKVVREVIIFPDGDVAGEAAAIKAAERFFLEGKTVKVARPPKDKDFNDLLCEAGEIPNDS